MDFLNNSKYNKQGLLIAGLHLLVLVNLAVEFAIYG